MTDPGHNTNAQLKSIVSRIEQLESEKADLAEAIKEIYTEAASNGYDKKALRAIIRMRKQDANKLAEHEAILEAYKQALGMIFDMPLGQAAMRQAMA